MPSEDSSAMERALRFGADRICLWRLCDNATCERARACRGDVRACAGLMAEWLAVLDVARLVRPTFAEIERALATPEDLRAYRAWREALAKSR